MFNVCDDKDSRLSFPVNRKATSTTSIKTYSINDHFSPDHYSASSDELNFNSDMNEEEGSFKHIEISPEPTPPNQVNLPELRSLIEQIRVLNKTLEQNFKIKNSSLSNESQKIEELGVENNSCACLKACQIN